MADPVLKFPPEQKGNPASPPKKLAAEPRRRLMAGLRRYRRVLLLVVLPLVAVLAGVIFYLNGGRYVTTDDAYVGAQKVLITPDISGKIDKVVVKEGQRVNQGDVLFEIDPVPFRLAVAQAKATLDQSQDHLRQSGRQHQDLRPDGRSAAAGRRPEAARRRTQDDAGQEQFRLAARPRQRLDRPCHRERASSHSSSSSCRSAKTQLLGNPNLPLEEFPPYSQAKAALAQAERNLDHTMMRAPMSGIATQVDQIQLGRFVDRRHAGILRDRHRAALGRRQSEGIGFHPYRDRPAGRHRRRCVSRSCLQGHHRLAEPRHRRAIRDPAAAERHRQFRQGGAARAGADLFRQQRPLRPEAESRHERLYHDRYRPSPLARRPARLDAGGGQNQD